MTKSLAGVISDAPPYTWTTAEPSVSPQVRVTVASRMGGSGLATGQLGAVAAWVDHTRAINPPSVDPTLRDRGAEIFEASACSACHPAPVDAALDADMASQTAGVSCSTCHLDGRSDGVVWNLPHRRRVTKALGGTVSETGPFTWTELSATVEAQARETVFERMGGRGIFPDQSVSLAAWIDAMRLPVALRPARDSPDWYSVLRGEELFREDLGCADCHIPEHHDTDGCGYPIPGDEQVTTPSLRGVSAHGPYFHNGRAAPLKEAVLAREMSDAWTLTEDELADLLAFLTIL